MTQPARPSRPAGESTVVALRDAGARSWIAAPAASRSSTDVRPAPDDAVRLYGASLANRPAQRYWSYSAKTKIARLLDHHGWERVADPRAARLVWGRSPERVPWDALRDGQLVDLVRGTEAITDKGGLARLLRASGLDGELQPETFLLEDPEEYRRFRERAVAEPDAVWIKKPTNRGSGIGVEVICDAVAFCTRLDADTAAGRTGDPCLVQRYIDNPLLLDGTKSEVRSYCLIASTDPLLVLYHDGTVRLSLKPYSDDWGDPLRHINNTYRQKRGDPDLYARVSDRLKWPLERLGSDLYARGSTPDIDFVDAWLRPRLRGVLREVIGAVAPRLERRAGSFQLLGMDCIVTDALDQVWLTEIQRGPGLAWKDPVKSRLIPGMLEEALEIVLEIADRRRSGAPLERIESVRNFKWVINDAAARA